MWARAAWGRYCSWLALCWCYLALALLPAVHQENGAFASTDGIPLKNNAHTEVGLIAGSVGQHQTVLAPPPQVVEPFLLSDGRYKCGGNGQCAAACCGSRPDHSETWVDRRCAKYMIGRQCHWAVSAVEYRLHVFGLRAANVLPHSLKSPSCNIASGIKHWRVVDILQKNRSAERCNQSAFGSIRRPLGGFDGRLHVAGLLAAHACGLPYCILCSFGGFLSLNHGGVGKSERSPYEQEASDRQNYGGERQTQADQCKQRLPLGCLGVAQGNHAIDAFLTIASILTVSFIFAGVAAIGILARVGLGAALLALAALSLAVALDAAWRWPHCHYCAEPQR